MSTTPETLGQARKSLARPHSVYNAARALETLAKVQPKALPEACCLLVLHRQNAPEGPGWAPAALGGFLDFDDERALGFLDGLAVATSRIRSELEQHGTVIYAAHGLVAIRIYPINPERLQHADPLPLAASALRA